MARFEEMDRGALQVQRQGLQARYAACKAREMSLNMTRGRPSPEQLDLSLSMLQCVGPDGYRAVDGIDCRNYGVLDGLPEAKALFAEMLEVEPEGVIVAGNSSLQLMHDTVARAMSHGVPGGETPWGQLPAVKFLCPSPGYDRHFRICEHFGIEMVTVQMLRDGPDMDAVESLVAEDESVKGIWCVPKYGNPTGVTFSDEIVDRLAGMETKAVDFRIMWDNSYAVHDLTDTPDRLKNLPAACKAAGNAERAYVFASFSKVTFAGAGLAAVAASETNIEDIKGHLFVQTIGPNKLNQLAHVRFLRDMDGIRAHMKKHAAIIKPKFDAVFHILEQELDGLGVAEWSKPNGGYFISLDTTPGCAKKVVEMAARAGVKLTPAGATFPYGRDPQDRNIRIAPTLPPLQEIRQATELLAICVQLAAIDELTT